MAYIDINSLDRTDAEISDTFDVYTISGKYAVPVTIRYSDLSGYFFDTDTFNQLSVKFDELQKLVKSFKDFMNNNYPQQSQLNGYLTTAQYLSSVIAKLMTVDKAKREYLNEYCTYNYAEYKKNQSYKFHEMLAGNYGESNRKIILDQLVYPDEIEEEEYESEEEDEE